MGLIDESIKNAMQVKSPARQQGRLSAATEAHMSSDSWVLGSNGLSTGTVPCFLCSKPLKKSRGDMRAPGQSCCGSSSHSGTAARWRDDNYTAGLCSPLRAFMLLFAQCSQKIEPTLADLDRSSHVYAGSQMRDASLGLLNSYILCTCHFE